MMIIKIGELYDLSCKYLNIQGEYEKEIDVKNLGITVDCPDGITNVNYIIKKKTEGLKLYFDNDNYLICANKHILYQDEKEIKAYDLKIGDYITTKNGNIKIINIEKSNIEDYYDISVDYPYVYYDANGIKHHNTLISAALAKLCQPYGKVILVVPSQDLCLQSADEFKLLGLDTGVVGCGLREFNHDIIVCTWQTINSLERRTKGTKKVKENPLSAEELKTLKSGVVSLIFDECFDGNTKILMADGTTKFIKNCKKGDKIISYNEKENKFEIDVVEKLHENLLLSSSEEMYELELENNEIVRVTGNHRVLTTDGWKMVKELTIDDEIISYVKDNKIIY